MSNDDHETVLPALLRAARGAYAGAVRSSLRARGYHDLPRNGPYVLGGMVNHGGSIAGLVQELGVSKQAASQLIDTLVVRGYLKRDIDSNDRRRVTVEPTELGVAAAQAVEEGREYVDRELAGMITAEQLAAMRAGLFALIDIRDRMAEAEQAGDRNPFEE